MYVQDMMKREVITITPSCSIRRALQLMVQHRIRHLPVIDEYGQLAGILSDRDIRDASPSKLRLQDDDLSILDTPVSQIMKRNVLTCHPLDFIEEAAHILYENKIGCLPVMLEKKIVGMITESDILYSLVVLMGVHQPSSRIEVEVPDRAGMLADVAQIFKDHQINISSVIVQPGNKPNTKRLVFRVQTMDPRNVLESIKTYGYSIIWPKDVWDCDRVHE